MMSDHTGFHNVGGLQEHLQCLKEMILFPLIYKDLYEKFKIKPPKGVLFYGPPGTGKTLVAGALANECVRVNRKVSFFSHKGAECLTKWVGESEKHLRTLFEKAQQLSPSIIFFDEIDGLAPIRSSHHDQVHSSVVSTLLALMDGLNTKGQVIVIGATNRIDAIDPALRRPGRFDRELYFPLPSLQARYEILMVHAERVSEQISLPFMRHLAASTDGYCGSDIQALCSEALMCSMRRQYPEIYKSDQPINLNVSVLIVERRDFRKAKTAIVPAALRVSHTPVKRMPSKIRPLFGHTLCRAMDTLRKTSLSQFLQTRKGHRRKLVDGTNSQKNSGNLKNGNICAHFLLVGTDQQGQTGYLAPAMLHCLEDLPVTTLDITSLFETSGRTPEEACIQKIKESRLSLPGVLYMPDISGWWDLVDDATRAVFLSLIREIDDRDVPILMLATAHVSYELLPSEIQKLFNDYQGQVFTMENPSEGNRKKFFSHLLIKKSLKPPSLGRMSKSGQKQVLVCNVPVTLPVEPCETAVSKSRGKKSKEIRTSATSEQTSKGPSPRKRNSNIPGKYQAKKKKIDFNDTTDDEDDELKEPNHSKRITSASCSYSAKNQRKLLQRSKAKNKKHAGALSHKSWSTGNSEKVLDAHHRDIMPQENDFPHECDEVDGYSSSSSSSCSSICGDPALMKASSKGDPFQSQEVIIDKNRLENLLDHTVNITENCSLHAILTLSSKLEFCVSKYKNKWDRLQLPQELEENLEMFENSVIQPRRN